MTFLKKNIDDKNVHIFTISRNMLLARNLRYVFRNLRYVFLSSTFQPNLVIFHVLSNIFVENCVFRQILIKQKICATLMTHCDFIVREKIYDFSVMSSSPNIFKNSVFYKPKVPNPSYKFNN